MGVRRTYRPSCYVAILYILLQTNIIVRPKHTKIFYRKDTLITSLFSLHKKTFWNDPQWRKKNKPIGGKSIQSCGFAPPSPLPLKKKKTETEGVVQKCSLLTWQNKVWIKTENQKLPSPCGRELKTTGECIDVPKPFTL